MNTLQDRLAEVMTAKGWTRADLVRESGESSSVISQWLDKGSKTIGSIGKIETALRLQTATGYSALWLAKGKGPKLAIPLASNMHPMVQQIVVWASSMTPDQLMKLYAAAHNAVNSSASELPSPTPTPKKHSA